jgi:hypothetical protein
MKLERLYGEIHLHTSLRHCVGAGGATTPSSVTPFSDFFSILVSDLAVNEDVWPRAALFSL